MSTRCEMIVKEDAEHLWFYRHSDGYPSYALKPLIKFMGMVSTGKIRDNVQQASGWLIVLGREENEELRAKFSDLQRPSFDANMGWKCGQIEPATCRHGDIEYLYILDLDKRAINVYAIPFDEDSHTDPENPLVNSGDKLLGTLQFSKTGKFKVTGTGLIRKRDGTIDLRKE